MIVEVEVACLYMPYHVIRTLVDFEEEVNPRRATEDGSAVRCAVPVLDMKWNGR